MTTTERVELEANPNLHSLTDSYQDKLWPHLHLSNPGVSFISQESPIAAHSQKILSGVILSNGKDVGARSRVEEKSEDTSPKEMQGFRRKPKVKTLSRDSLIPFSNKGLAFSYSFVFESTVMLSETPGLAGPEDSEKASSDNVVSSRLQRNKSECVAKARGHAAPFLLGDVSGAKEIYSISRISEGWSRERLCFPFSLPPQFILLTDEELDGNCLLTNDFLFSSLALLATKELMGIIPKEKVESFPNRNGIVSLNTHAPLSLDQPVILSGAFKEVEV